MREGPPLVARTRRNDPCGVRFGLRKPIAKGAEPLRADEEKFAGGPKTNLETPAAMSYGNA